MKNDVLRAISMGAIITIGIEALYAQGVPCAYADELFTPHGNTYYGQDGSLITKHGDTLIYMPYNPDRVVYPPVYEPVYEPDTQRYLAPEQIYPANAYPTPEQMYPSYDD